jgi:hypothetical protein
MWKTFHRNYEKEQKMLIPVDARNLTIIAIGDPIPQFVYGTNERRKNKLGQEIYKLPVLISGSGERQDPTTTITIAGAVNVNKGIRLIFTNLVIQTWSLKGSDGVLRNGITLKADGVQTAPKVA